YTQPGQATGPTDQPMPPQQGPTYTTPTSDVTYIGNPYPSYYYSYWYRTSPYYYGYGYYPYYGYYPASYYYYPYFGLSYYSHGCYPYYSHAYYHNGYHNNYHGGWNGGHSGATYHSAWAPISGSARAGGHI